MTTEAVSHLSLPSFQKTKCAPSLYIGKGVLQSTIYNICRFTISSYISDSYHISKLHQRLCECIFHILPDSQIRLQAGAFDLRPGHLSNYPQCAINSTRCLQVPPSLGGTMLIAACHTDRVSNTFNSRLDLLTTHVDKQTRFLPSLSNIFPDSPVFVHKHMFPALTQNIGEKEEEAMPHLLVGCTARPEDDCYTLATRNISTRLALQKLITKPHLVRALQDQTHNANNAACKTQPLMKYQIA